MRLELAPRLNLLIGDNSLGKTFILDVAWFALTRTWSSQPATPRREQGVKPEITRRVRLGNKSREITSTFKFESFDWYTLHADEEATRRPNLVLYAQVNGDFTVWDPVRIAGQYRLPFNAAAYGLSSAFHFNQSQLWNGLNAQDDGQTFLCNGLIRDWAYWQLQGGVAYETLMIVLNGLLPGPQIQPGTKTARVSVHDVRDIPTLQMPYGEIPIIHSSAGLRRILSLAYLIVWMWREHNAICSLEKYRTKRVLGIPHRRSGVTPLSSMAAANPTCIDSRHARTSTGLVCANIGDNTCTAGSCFGRVKL